jgi:biopolymer transport protein ExbD
MPKVYINSYYGIFFENQRVGDVSRLSKVIQAYMAGRKEAVKGIVLYADIHQEYGKISAVLEQIRKANIKSVFISEGPDR